MKLEFESLIAYVKDNIQLVEFDEMFKVFLIKKILQQLEESSAQSYESNLLTKLNAF
jgi:hypothetical protein